MFEGYFDHARVEILRFKVQRASRRRIDVLQVTRAAAPAELVE